MKFLVVSSILLSAQLSAATSKCFFPDGSMSDGLVQCNMEAEESHCCRSADACLSNGWCFSSGLGTIVRRGCTQKTWNTSACGEPITKPYVDADSCKSTRSMLKYPLLLHELTTAR